jgi:importin subunit alpha-1
VHTLLGELAAAGVELSSPEASKRASPEDKRPRADCAPLLARTLAVARDPKILYSLARAFREMLSVEKAPPIDAVLAAGALPRLVELLALDAHPLVQFEALWALTNIASGCSSNTRAVMDAGAVPPFVRLLASPDPDVKNQAAWALGNVAGDGVALRDAVLAAGALPPLLAATTLTSGLPSLANVTWTLSNLCRGKPAPSMDHTREMLPKLAQLITSDDKNVQQDAMWALSYLSDGDSARLSAFLEVNALPRIVQLLSSPHTEVVTPALRTIGNIVTGDELQTQAVINEGALHGVRALMTNFRRNIRKEACWMVSNVCAGTPGQIQAVFDCNLFPALIHQLTNGEADVQREACWALSNATTGGTAQQIYDLVRLGAVAPLGGVLRSTVQDPKVQKVALEGLANILSRSVPPGNTGCYFSTLEQEEVPDKVLELTGSDNAMLSSAATAFMAKWFPDWLDADGVDGVVDALVIVRATGAPLAARLAACTTCWLASPRACACAEKRHECPICQDPENEDGGPWTALSCGHLYHEKCIARWAAHASKGARAVAQATGRMPSHTAVQCPLDRKCITCVVRLPRAGGGERAEHLRVVDVADGE